MTSQPSPAVTACRTRFPAQIDELLVEEISPRKMRLLRAHLEGCLTCRQRYNKVVLAGRLLEGGPEALTIPSEGELRRVREEVMRRLQLVPDARPRTGAVSWVAALATCAVVLAIALPLVLHRARPPRGVPAGEVSENAASGAVAAESVASSNGQLGLRAFCVAHIGGLPQVTVLAPAGSCRTGDAIKFAYTNQSRLSYLFLVGVDEKYAIKWYEPRPPERRSVKVRTGVSDEPVAQAVPLSVEHQPGELRVFALFTARPLGSEEIERAVAQVQKRGVTLDVLAELPIRGCGQQSLLIKLQP